jgi:hypothetical protein
MANYRKFFDKIKKGDYDKEGSQEDKKETWEEAQARRKRYQDKLTPKEKAEREAKQSSPRKAYEDGGVVEGKFEKLKAMFKSNK